MTQDEAFQVLTIGKSVFLTGAAGSGKTHLLNRYIHWLKLRGIDVAVTASTGIAATHIGGQTIHSWSGIGIKDSLSSYDLDRIEQSERLVKRFRNTRVLILDEVSMLSGHTLTVVDQALRAGLQKHDPFGGLQVVLCGDFFQLPPVVRGGGDVQMAFESTAWRSLEPNTCYLTEQYRQDEGGLLDLLNAIRTGGVSAEHRALLTAQLHKQAPEDIPHLYTHNVDVDAQNSARLAALPEKVHRFTMSSKGSKKNVEMLKRGLLVPEVLELKVGAAVMFVKNHPHGTYVNGTLGTVTGFSSNVPQVKTRDGATIHAEPESWKIEDGDRVRAEVVQVPLRLAWAVTIHKSQGLTLDAARIDLSKTFVPGQGYVALSRVRSLEGLYLEGLHNAAYDRHERVAAVDGTFRQASSTVERRLTKTGTERLEELSTNFIEESGGHPPISDHELQAQSAEKKQSTYEKTLVLVKEECSLQQIADKRSLVPNTILAHVEHLLENGTLTNDDLACLLPQQSKLVQAFEDIAAAFLEAKSWNLAPARRILKNKYSYDEVRLARLFIRPWQQH